jgi:uncharacterized protein (TIGR02246 family)
MYRHRLILAGLLLMGTATFAGARLLFPAQAVVPAVQAQGVQAPAQPPAPAGQPVPAPVANAVETGVRQSAAEYVKAFNAHDANAAATLYTENAQFVSLDGVVLQGRAAIEKSLASSFKANPGDKIAITVQSVQPLSKQSAMVTGELTLTDPNSLEPIVTRYSAMEVLEDGAWRAATVREWMPNTQLTAAQRHLEWMVGQWTATGLGGTFLINYTWGEPRTFLYGKYTLTRDGKVVSSGTDILAINALEGGLRSWTFDNSGTFSNGVWTREGNSWVDESAGTLPDGSTLNAENVLTRVGPNAFTWQTPERFINGQPIEPLPPIKFIRVGSTVPGPAGAKIPVSPTNPAGPPK